MIHILILPDYTVLSEKVQNIQSHIKYMEEVKSPCNSTCRDDDDEQFNIYILICNILFFILLFHL